MSYSEKGYAIIFVTIVVSLNWGKETRCNNITLNTSQFYFPLLNIINWNRYKLCAVLYWNTIGIKIIIVALGFGQQQHDA